MYAVSNAVRMCAFFVLMLVVPTSTAPAQTFSSQDPHGGVRLPAADTTSVENELQLIDLLHTSLGTLADRDRRGRHIGGYVLLGLGIGSAIGGGATLAFAEGGDATTAGLSLIGVGAVLGGLSLIPFYVRSEPERIYAAFEGMSTDDPAQIHQKYNFGEHSLEALALKNKRSRIIGGAIMIAVASASSFMFVDDWGSDRLHTFIWPTVAGVASILIPSDEERSFRAYRQTKDDLLARQTGTGIAINVGPLSGRLCVALRVDL